nr:crosslink repair DNA glycosylase YcaQ family protein [Allosalinactinospora lopnorensis]
MPVAVARAWTGLPMDPAPGVERMVARYLAAFGPAGIRDLSTWSGLPQRLLRPAVERLGGRLRTYRDEQGRQLFDVPDAPLADPELPAPARFLPGYDNLILSHADRSRVISDAERPRVSSGAVVQPTFLVDGFVRGVWSLEGPVLRIHPFRPLPEADTAALLAEADHLAAFVADEGTEPRVEFSV